MNHIRIFHFAIILVVFFVCLSCSFFQKPDNAESVSSSGAYISVSIPFYAVDEHGDFRTVLPSWHDYPVKRYVITATQGTESCSVQNTNVTGLAKLNLSTGEWNVTVLGYPTLEKTDGESANSAICTASGTISVDDDCNGYCALTAVPIADSGNGSVDLTLRVPASVVTCYSAKFTNSTGFVAKTWNDEPLDNGMIQLAIQDVSSGVYILDINLYGDSSANDSSILYHHKEIVYVWMGFVTNCWVDHFLPQNDAATVLSVFEISTDDLAKTDTSFINASLSVQNIQYEYNANNNFRPVASDSRLQIGTRVVCADTIDPDGFSVTVAAGQSVTLANLDDTTFIPVTIKKSNDNYRFTWKGFQSSAMSGNALKLTVTASNGVTTRSYILPYGPVYVQNDIGSDDEGYGSANKPYKTIEAAIADISDSFQGYSCADNRIILLSDYTADSGSVVNDSLITIVDELSTTESPFILCIDGSSHTVKAAGSAANTQRVLFVGANSNVTLQDMMITGGYASDNGGGIFVKSGAALTLNNVTIQSCNAGENGGAVYLSKDSSFTISGSTVISKGESGDNTVYLANTEESNHAVITVGNIVAGTSYVATVTPSSYSENLTVLQPAEGVVLNQDTCNRFTVTPHLEPVNTYTYYNVFYDDAKKNGVITKYGTVTLETENIVGPSIPVFKLVLPNGTTALQENMQTTVTFAVRYQSSGTALTPSKSQVMLLYENAVILRGDEYTDSCASLTIPGVFSKETTDGKPLTVFITAMLNGFLYSASFDIPWVE